MSAMRIWVTTASLVATIGCAVAACSPSENIYIPVNGDSTADGGTTNDAGDAGGAGGAGGSASNNACLPSCDGTCAPLPPPGFSHPFLFAQSSQPVACPDSANLSETRRFAELHIPPMECGSCACAPSTGECTQPKTITAHAADCNHTEGAIASPTNPPASWNGACTSDNALAAGITCAGKACVQSITVGPMGIAHEECGVSWVHKAEDTRSPWWRTYATACQGLARGTCDAALCVPGQTDGFQLCVERDGIHDCPSEGYTKQFVVYDGFKDERTCEACSCGAPEGSFCQAWLTVHANGACSSPVVAGNVWSGGNTCLDVTPPSAAVGSKQALEPKYQAGSCKPSGGTVSGEVALNGSHTVCCLA